MFWVVVTKSLNPKCATVQSSLVQSKWMNGYWSILRRSQVQCVWMWWWAHICSLLLRQFQFLLRVLQGLRVLVQLILRALQFLLQSKQLVLQLKDSNDGKCSENTAKQTKPLKKENTWNIYFCFYLTHKVKIGQCNFVSQQESAAMLTGLWCCFYWHVITY